MSNETKCETNYSINNKWNNTRNKLFTKHDTNDDVDLDNCVVHVERTLSHLMLSHTSLAQVLSLFTFIHGHHHGAPSLTRLPLSTSTCSSLSSFPSTSCTPSCTLSSTTCSPWKACASPPTRGVTTPTTCPPPSQVMRVLLLFQRSTLAHKSSAVRIEEMVLGKPCGSGQLFCPCCTRLACSWYF